MRREKTERKIDIIGNAKNINGRPAIMAENVGVYFVEGLNEWKNEWHNKQIKVIGDLKRVKKIKWEVIKNPVVQLIT